MLDAKVVISVPFEGWGHFTEGEESLRKEFNARLLQHLQLVSPGERFQQWRTQIHQPR